MLSGFTDYFWQTPTQTRLEKCEHLKHLPPLLTRLRNKEAELNKAGMNEGPGSLSYRKYLILSKLLKELDKEINTFNAVTLPANQEEDVQEVIKFVRRLAEIIQEFRKNYEHTLMAERNQQRETMSTFVTYGAYGTAIATLPFTTVGGIAMLFFGAPLLKSLTTDAAGLNDKVPASVHIIDELILALIHIGENLGMAKNWNLLEGVKQDDVPPEYLCPILGNIMEHPVVCSLDEQTYEKDAITKWLTEHRTSPLNRRQLADGQPVDSVLVQNRNLKDAIVKWRDAHPQLFDQEYLTEVEPNNIPAP